MGFFFTLLDDSLRPRGSRDPIGIEMVWSNAGRRLIGNLTTVTDQLENFIFALLGFYLCGQEGRTPPSWELFERFEQATGHARYRQSSNADVIGINAIKRMRDRDTLPLGASVHARILQDQRRAGMWGLYASALAASGLTGGSRQLTRKGLAAVRPFLDMAPVRPCRFILDVGHRRMHASELAALEEWVSAVRQCAAGRKNLADILLSGDSERLKWQQELYLQGKIFLSGQPADTSPRAFLRYLTAHSGLLQEYARRLLILDEVLALATLTFDFLLRCRRQTENEVIRQMRSSALPLWPKDRLDIPDFREMAVDREWLLRVQRLNLFCHSIRDGQWLTATQHLLAHHTAVAKARGGAPWCFWEGGYFNVVMNGGQSMLPNVSQVSGATFEQWMGNHSSGFFLTSFLDILSQAGVVEGRV